MDFDEDIVKLEREKLLRELPPLVERQGVEAVVGGQKIVLMCSNNYLGMCQDKRVKNALAEGAKFCAGSGASRLVAGNMPPHRDLEKYLADFLGYEEAILFNSGYCANTGAIPALTQDDSAIFSDELNHASIIDGCKLSRAKKYIYSHLDLNHLEELLRQAKERRKIIITESIFSMDGDVAPLAELEELALKYGASLFVDEAHAFGIYGDNGRGKSAEMGIKPDILLVTLSKSVGLFGGVILSSKTVCNLIRSRARSFIFSTSLPPCIPYAAITSIDIIRKERWRAERLLWLSRRMREELRKMSFISGSTTQIIPIIIGDAHKTVKLSEWLLERRFFVQGIRPPSVPRGTSRLRVIISALHTNEHISEFLKTLQEWKAE